MAATTVRSVAYEYDTIREKGQWLKKLEGEIA